MAYNNIAPPSQVDAQSIPGAIKIQAPPASSGMKTLTSSSVIGEPDHNGKSK